MDVKFVPFSDECLSYRQQFEKQVYNAAEILPPDLSAIRKRFLSAYMPDRHSMNVGLGEKQLTQPEDTCQSSEAKFPTMSVSHDEQPVGLVDEKFLPSESRIGYYNVTHLGQKTECECESVNPHSLEFRNISDFLKACSGAKAERVVDLIRFNRSSESLDNPKCMWLFDAACTDECVEDLVRRFLNEAKPWTLSTSIPVWANGEFIIFECEIRHTLTSIGDALPDVEYARRYGYDSIFLPKDACYIILHPSAMRLLYIGTLEE